MALIISDKTRRTVPVEAKEPLDGDKFTVHRFDVEYEIIDKNLWKEISTRWDELAFLLRNKPETLTDSELQEAREPVLTMAKPYIKNIGPIRDEQGNAVPFTDDLLEMLLSQDWLQSSIVDGFLQVQRGMTSADYKKARRGN